MSRPSSTTEREIIQEQLIQAKKTLARLRKISDSQANGEPNNDWRDDDIRTTSSRAEGRNSTETYRYSTAARDNLVQALGYQVSKLEDDLKSSLLSYFEQVERQKDDLINSFNVMQKQLLNHQQTCHEQTLEVVEKDAVIRDLKDEKQQLENELERMTTERNLFDGLDLSIESMHSESLSNFSGYASDKSEMSEKLLQENAKLREMLGQQRDDTNRSRLERKVELQSKLCHSYDKDLASKDLLIKRLKAENKGLLYDVQTMQDEVLKVNANRLSAEQDKSRLQQENHFKDEQIFALREQLDSKGVYKYQCPTRNGFDHLGSVDEDVIELQKQCDNYKRKLHEKDKAVFDMQREKLDLYKNLDSLKKELSDEKHETQRMKRENERLQRENADRDIERLSTESTTKARDSKINQLKDRLSNAEYEMKELQRKCEVSEKREADLTKEVLTSLEKYSQTEQELYSTKKELAHLRGYSESHDRHNDEMQRELQSERENTARLEKELRSKNYNSIANDKLQTLKNENRQLRELNTHLEDELSRRQSDVNQFHSELETVREQCSIQKVRLDGQETMIKRKDERIKELQDELVGLHNQNDALMDELLQTNRNNGNSKINKQQRDHEMDVPRTGNIPRASGPHRDNLMTPDSGYHENPRHTTSSQNMAKRGTKQEGGERLRKELDLMCQENNRLKRERDKMAALLREMENKLQKMKTGEEEDDKEQISSKTFRDKEKKLNNEIHDLKKELSILKDENESLREKTEELDTKLSKKDNKGVSPRLLAFNDQIEALESAPEVDLFGDFASEDKNVVYPKHANLEGKMSEQQHGSLGNASVTASDGPLIDFNVTPLKSTEVDPQYAGIDLIDAGNKDSQITKKDIENYEAQIQSISADKQQMEDEMKELRSLLKKTNEEHKLSKKDTDKMEMQRTKELKVKDNQIEGLKKELTSEKRKYKELDSQIDELRKHMKEKDQQLKNLKTKLENEENAYKNKLKEMEEKVQGDEHSFEITHAKLSDLEHEIEESQNEKMETIKKFRELQREKRNLEEDIDLLQKDKNKMEKKVKEYENEKDEIVEKYEEAKQNIKELKIEQRKLQEEKDDIDYDLNELLKQKNREIKKLNDDLDASESRYGDLRRTWDSSNLQSSDLKNDLMRAKEECIELMNKNEELNSAKKDMAKDLESKEKVIEGLREVEEDLKMAIDDREKGIDKLQERFEDLQGENMALQEECNELRNALETANDEQREVETRAERLEGDLEKAQSTLLESQDKLSALEENSIKTNAENDILKDKLSKIEKRMVDLQKREDTAQTEVIEAEKRAKTAEKKSKELTVSLNKSNDDLVYVKNKLTKTENKLAELEEAQSESEEQHKILQRKLQDATNELNDMSLLSKDQEDRQKNIDKRITELRDYSEELEAERDDLEFTVKEMKKKLEKQKKKVQALEDELLDKQKEKDTVQQELELLRLNASSTESEQTANQAEREKLKKDILQASKKVMDLEAENDAQKENIEELEKLLDQKRASVLDLEDYHKEATEKVVILQVQHEEDQRLITTLQEDNANLEKMLEKQRQLSEGYKGSLAQKDAEISKLAFSRDDTENALQLLKKDLARRQGVNKANQQELDEVC